MRLTKKMLKSPENKTLRRDGECWCFWACRFLSLLCIATNASLPPWTHVLRYGGKVSSYPLSFSLVFYLLCGVFCGGMYWYREEGNPYKLWIPQDSDFVRNTEWLWDNFPPEMRIHSVIITSETNVLEPEVMEAVSSFCHSFQYA